MGKPVELFDVVALDEDLPVHGLVRGQVGTVVETLSPGVYEVEFHDDEGNTYAMLPMKTEQLIVLHNSPVRTP